MDEGSLSLVTDMDDVDSAHGIHNPNIIDTSSSINLSANIDVTPQMLSTFLRRGGTHITTRDFSHVDGDLV